MRACLFLLLGACVSGTISLDDTATTTDTDTDTVVTPVTATDLTWTLHSDYGSLVYAAWQQDGDALVHVEYSVDDGVWLSSPSMPRSAGANQQLLVGIPYEMDALWRVVIEGQESYDGPLITTGPLLEDLPEPDLELTDEAAWSGSGDYLLTSVNENAGGWVGGTYVTVILDRMGRYVWVNETPDGNWTLYAQVALSGDHLLWDEATYWSNYDDGEDSQIHRTYLDEEIEVLATPGLHHAFVQLPDGTLTWGSQWHESGEALVELAPGASDADVIWTCRDDWPDAGRCESNGIFYSPDRDSYLYSFYTNNSIVEVDRATGESLWWAGGVRDGYTFADGDDQYSWQHGISWTDTGTLLVSTEYPYESREQTTWAVEYEVDHDAQELTMVWGSDSEVYASTNGDTWRLDNGNTLHIVGAAGVARETNAAGDDVWRIAYNNDYLLGRGELIDDLYALVKPPE